MQNTTLIPTSTDVIETVAKSIARVRLKNDVREILQSHMNIPPDIIPAETYDAVFENMWSNPSEMRPEEKRNYYAEAEAAINALNMKIITG